MDNLEKYKGVIPAFYACYDEQGNISPERVRKLTEYLIGKGVKGVYVNGSSGECIYQSVEERKTVIENVMEVARGRITVINHVACNNTKDSVELARHSEKVGVDAIAAIPPIYFHLPEYSISKYWNEISAAAPNTDFRNNFYPNQMNPITETAKPSMEPPNNQKLEEQKQTNDNNEDDNSISIITEQKSAPKIDEAVNDIFEPWSSADLLWL